MAIKTGMKPVHPCEFIRQAILPDDLTGTDAAKILGVGRPALSNLLSHPKWRCGWRQPLA